MASQADSNEYALGCLTEHFHEVEEAGLCHWAAQAQLFPFIDNGTEHRELLGKSIISQGVGITSSKIKDNTNL